MSAHNRHNLTLQHWFRMIQRSEVNIIKTSGQLLLKSTSKIAGTFVKK